MNEFQKKCLDLVKNISDFKKKKEYESSVKNFKCGKCIYETDLKIHTVMLNRSLPLKLMIKDNKASILKKKHCVCDFSSDENCYFHIFDFDIFSKNHKYMRKIFSLIERLTGNNSKQMIGNIKSIRHQRFNPLKEWEEALSPNIVRWALDKLHNISENYDYVDNFRVAKFGNTSQMRRYKRDRNNGCCGFYDKIVDGPGGKYLIGFNYGH